MSTITATAELEAAIAEAELTDEEAERAKAIAAEGLAPDEAVAAVVAEREPAEPPTPTPTPPEPESGEPTDKQLASLDREQERHEKRVREIMGGFVAGFEPCDKCSGVGLTSPGPTAQTNENFKACDTCEGFGLVLTGSLRPGQESRDCPTCLGRGYLERLTEQGASVAPQPGTVAAPLAVVPSPPLEPAPAENGATQPAERFGVPTWMGDPSLGR